MKVFKYFLPADTEQRTDNSAIMGANTRETMNARTSKKVHQHGLYSIVTMVSHTDRRSTNIVEQLTEITIAQLTGRHFKAYLMQ